MSRSTCTSMFVFFGSY